MYKIGNDIVLISRIEKSIKSPSFLNKVFTENERLYCKKAENFAGLFAERDADGKYQLLRQSTAVSAQCPSRQPLPLPWQMSAFSPTYRCIPEL